MNLDDFIITISLLEHGIRMS